MNLANFLQIILPTKKARKDGVTQTPHFDPNADQGKITAPLYRDHLTDVFDSRQVQDSRELMSELFRADPDVSATVNSYLTLANTEMIALARDMDGNIDREATKQLHGIFKALTTAFDYTLGFQLKPNLRSLSERLRYMALLRGTIGAELILNEQLQPHGLRIVDMDSIEWREKKAGQLKPVQIIQDKEINLDLPTFFVSHFRPDPTSPYGWSFFIAAINTIAARQQVINDLYRIMRITGFPRLEITVLEEILLKNAPADIKNDAARLEQWKNAQLNAIRNTFSNLRADQAFIHTDSITINQVEGDKAGAELKIGEVIDTLNAQNQAGLKTMSTVIGRGTSGVNTSSVEARIASMNADELNEPVAELLENVGSFCLHQQGFQGFAEVWFRDAELRPELELEPQKSLKAARLRKDLSDGLITDDEYHMEMYGRLPPDGAPDLSGTGFESAAAGGVEPEDVSPNGDPLGRSLTGEGSTKQTRSNGVK